jgi:hypothetical protein
MQLHKPVELIDINNPIVNLYTLNPKPYTLYLIPYALNPKPWTLNLNSSEDIAKQTVKVVTIDNPTVSF